MPTGAVSTEGCTHDSARCAKLCIMTAMRALLDRFDLDEDEVARAVAVAVGDLPASGAAALTGDEVRILTRAGLEFGDEVEAAGQRAHRDAVAEQVALLAGPDTAAVAHALEVSESRVRHQAAAGMLLGVRVGRGLRFPLFQFDPDGRPLPGLRVVLAAVPPWWPPAQLAAFMSTPQPELAMRAERPETPAAWLAAGGDPVAVTALLEPDWA